MLCLTSWSDVLINSKITGSSQTFPDWPYLVFISKLQSSNCSSVRPKDRSLYLSLSSSSSPSVLSLSLCFFALFPGQFFYFFISSSPRVVLSGPVLPETPSTSPLSVFFLFPFRLLSLLTLYLLPLNFLSFSLSHSHFPSHPLLRDKKGKPS